MANDVRMDKHKPKPRDDANQASEATLTDEQIVDLRRRSRNPGPIATEAEVEAFFARFRRGR